MHPILERIIGFFMVLGSIVYYSFIAPLLPKGIRHKNVRGQIVLITGGGSGFGREMAKKFGELGCIVVIWDINQAGMEGTAKLVKDNGGRIHSYAVDVSSRDQIYATAKKVQAEVGKVDILVNNAGIAEGDALVDMRDDYIEKVFKINIISNFWTTKAFLPAMISTKKGHIVTIASSAGLFGVPNLTAYCATKHAAVGFHESLTNELKLLHPDAKIETTVICPYFVKTGIIAGKEDKIPKSTAFLPIREVEPVVEEFMDAILSNQQFLIPAWGIRILLFVKSNVPTRVMQKLREHIIKHPKVKSFK